MIRRTLFCVMVSSLAFFLCRAGEQPAAELGSIEQQGSVAAESSSLVQSEQTCAWVVERLSIERIQKHAMNYQSRLKRSDTVQKALWCAGGCAASAVLIWACYKLFCVEKKAKTVEPTSSFSADISEQDFRRRALAALEAEIDDDARAQRSIWESIKRGSYNGAAVAFYSFIGTSILGMLYSTWDNVGAKFFDFLGLFSPKDQIAMHGQMLHLIGQSMSGLIPEYGRVVYHALELGGNDSASASFMTFLERDIVRQHAAFVHALELVIACLSEVQLHNSNKDNEKLQQVFDNNVRVFWGVVDAYAGALEKMLNVPLTQEKSIFCKRVSIMGRQIYLQAEHFVQQGENIILAP